MRKAGILGCVVVLAAAGIAGGKNGGDKKSAAGEKGKVSFSADVFPIIKKNCLPCHAEYNFNPSELSLDSYELLMAGGKNGESVVPGNAQESILVRKLQPDPPFGDRMPLDLKKKKGQKSAKVLSEEEVRVIATWIDQGAGNN